MLDVTRVIVTWQLQVVPEHLRATLPYPEELDSTQTSRVCRLGLFDHVVVTGDETYFCGSLGSRTKKPGIAVESAPNCPQLP